jgi:hypothetical protein
VSSSEGLAFELERLERQARELLARASVSPDLPPFALTKLDSVVASLEDLRSRSAPHLYAGAVRP